MVTRDSGHWEVTVRQAKANYTRGGGRGPEEGIFPNVKRLAVLLECNKNISKHLPFIWRSCFLGVFQKGMLGEIFFACGSFSHLFPVGGSQETHQQKHTSSPNDPDFSFGRQVHLKILQLLWWVPLCDKRAWKSRRRTCFER